MTTENSRIKSQQVLSAGGDFRLSPTPIPVTHDVCNWLQSVAFPPHQSSRESILQDAAALRQASQTFFRRGKISQPELAYK
ncbi:hypothetical protein KCP77_22010 [Salmonella enterica subsp. enterica]|nr:hypothetical protein KCP77_22010 [Salmonella enterica subsp. enterica]